MTFSVLFEKPDNLQQFAEYINKQYTCIRFPTEAEKNDVL